MEHALLEKFRELVSAGMGLAIHSRDEERLAQVIAARQATHRCATAEEYYDLLSKPSAARGAEWQELGTRLTIGESYFFRDQGQIALLTNQLLPEIIERNRGARALRLWSAGCSTGEEPYTLAILLDRLLPDQGDWNVAIFGTDINRQALEAADRAVYGAWSFRNVSPEIRERYFTRCARGWRLDERIRARVTFACHNLRDPRVPDDVAVLGDMDLIMCRNVLIYFSHSAVGLAIETLTDALKEGAFLLTGHGELHGHRLDRLQTQVFPESVVYRRREASPAGSAPPLAEPRTTRHEPSTRIVFPPIGKPGQRAHPRETHSPKRGAVGESEPLLTDAPRDSQLLSRLAQARANAGQMAQAADLCQRAIAVDPMDPAPYYLLAHIAEDRGERAEAKAQLKKIIYLAPNFVAAYLDLGQLYAVDQDAVRARKMRESALALLLTMAPDTPVEQFGGVTAGNLAREVAESLRR